MRLSKFGYGTGHLHHVREKERIKLIKYALDCGITHFDTAPYYGYGVCERALSYISHEDITITTKFGIEVTGGNDQSYIEMSARKAIGRIIPSLNKVHLSYSIKNAEKSLEASLRRLKREKIDFFMMHEPSIGLLNMDEIHRWVENKISQGKILNFGVAGEKSKIKALSTELNGLSSNIQTNTSFDDLETDLKIDYFFRYGWINEYPVSKINDEISNIINDKGQFLNQCHLFSSFKKSTIAKYKV